MHEDAQAPFPMPLEPNSPYTGSELSEICGRNVPLSGLIDPDPTTTADRVCDYSVSRWCSVRKVCEPRVLCDTLRLGHAGWLWPCCSYD